MINNLVRYLTLTAKAKTGLGTDVFVWGLVALIGAVAALIFGVVATFIALAEAYTPLTAALILAGIFLLIAVLAAIVCLIMHRRTVTDAKTALAARGNAAWLDPRLLAPGLQLVRSIGLRRLVPLAAVGFLAGGLAREWMVSHGAHADGDAGSAS